MTIGMASDSGGWKATFEGFTVTAILAPGRAYARLARSAIALLRPKGILVACSCSAHVSTAEFLEAVRAGRELQITGHAPDHPATFPEANYLKAIYQEF